MYKWKCYQEWECYQDIMRVSISSPQNNCCWKVSVACEFWTICVFVFLSIFIMQIRGLNTRGWDCNFENNMIAWSKMKLERNSSKNSCCIHVRYFNTLLRHIRVQILKFGYYILVLFKVITPVYFVTKGLKNTN